METAEFTGFEASEMDRVDNAGNFRANEVTDSNGNLRSEASATEPQIKFINDLRERKNLTADQLAWLDKELPLLGKGRASTIIERLLKLADKPREHGSPQEALAGNGWQSTTPDGYYALTGLEGYANETNFFRLNTGKNGRWKGFQFIDHIVAGGHDHPIKGEGRAKIYTAINDQGINEARQLYGRTIGRCGVCGRMLTDDTSRALGIGPVCAEGF